MNVILLVDGYETDSVGGLSQADHKLYSTSIPSRSTLSLRRLGAMHLDET